MEKREQNAKISSNQILQLLHCQIKFTVVDFSRRFWQSLCFLVLSLHLIGKLWQNKFLQNSTSILLKTHAMELRFKNRKTTGRITHLAGASPFQNPHWHNSQGYDLTSNSPARVRARKPLYGRLGKFFRSNLSICSPERATPMILKPTWNVGDTWRRSKPVSRSSVPDIDGALSFGIRPINQEQVCNAWPVRSQKPNREDWSYGKI